MFSRQALMLRPLIKNRVNLLNFYFPSSSSSKNNFLKVTDKAINQVNIFKFFN